MPREGYQQPPWDYQCPYRHNCPHLQGLSTQWVFEEYQRSYDEHLDHWKIRDIQQEQLEKALAYIGELEKKNEQLKAKLKAIHQRQFKSNKKDNRISAPDEAKGSAGVEKNKKQGAPRGHPGWCRPRPDHIDKTVIVKAPQVCPHCSFPDLIPVEDIKDHLQEDIVFQPRTHVTQFKHHQAFCPKCRCNVLEAANGELLNCHIGPTTKAAAVFLRYGLHLPYRKVQQLFDVFFNMSFVPASAMAFDRMATRNGQPLYEDLKEKLRQSASVNADETGWRQDGTGHYLWYAGNHDLALFHIDRHRSSEVAEQILGNDFSGVLNTDGYAAYNAINAKDRQSCLAHLIRKSEEIKQEIELKKPRFQDKPSIRFCDRLAVLFKKACEIGRSEIESHRIDTLQKRLYSVLNTICLNKLADPRAETFRQRLLNPKKDHNRLFTFLKYPDVEPTNNQAERSLRNMVIFRKVCFGTRSEQGSCSHSVLPSLLFTAQRQGHHPLDFLKTLFSSDTATAQAALYNDSS